MGGARVVRVALALALAGTIGVATDAAAKRSKLVAKVNGKRFKANLPGSVRAAVTSNGVILTGTSHRGLRNGTTKSLTISCAVSLATVTLPVTVDCAGAYLVAVNRGVSVTEKGWAGGNGLQVTFKSFDGTTATGTFEGGNWPAGDTNPSDPPAVFSRGKFVAGP